MSKPAAKKRTKLKAWADVGSHGLPFEFIIGPVAEKYPHLLQIYSRQVTPDLVPVEIHIKRRSQ